MWLWHRHFFMLKRKFQYLGMYFKLTEVYLIWYAILFDRVGTQYVCLSIFKQLVTSAQLPVVGGTRSSFCAMQFCNAYDDTHAQRERERAIERLRFCHKTHNMVSPFVPILQHNWLTLSICNLSYQIRTRNNTLCGAEWLSPVALMQYLAVVRSWNHWLQRI